MTKSKQKPALLCRVPLAHVACIKAVCEESGVKGQGRRPVASLLCGAPKHLHDQCQWAKKEKNA